MTRIIFDIETVGLDFDSLDTATQSSLLKWTKTEEDENRVKDGLSLNPLTAEIIAIGMLNPDTDKGSVFFQARGDAPLLFEEDNIRFESATEKNIIEKFWAIIKSYNQFITFNGRGFDCPFIMIRSAAKRIKPIRELMPNRYGDTHIDLMDQFTFYGAFKRFSLDMLCKGFNIKSPKSDGITGCEVKDAFNAGRYVDIARYCAGDLRATKELLFIWEKYIRLKKTNPI
ncbi:MAG: ribonuclease H-like domain-containing protein [Nitrospirae bacterium]|nr:ribonuclease H-like domain-containing protein [Nitrospirota bacterium]